MEVKINTTEIHTFTHTETHFQTDAVVLQNHRKTFSNKSRETSAHGAERRYCINWRLKAQTDLMQPARHCADAPESFYFTRTELL